MMPQGLHKAWTWKGKQQEEQTTTGVMNRWEIDPHIQKRMNQCLNHSRGIWMVSHWRLTQEAMI